ncbi:ion transporter [Sphingomonas sp. RG327]|jgi:voltage-gated potassium channel|uniref:Ion transporter n=1 Tax=Sphingomonas anseongensis TaxID=2908207 RepID=A0ABT0RC26_9SPHN|nr:ion transporter [Sphingomonas anseongensis]MCL6677813.1 ion transporter [Sphingomonas anseongensis]
MSLRSLRLRAYRQLEPTAWTSKGLSPTNWVLASLILIAVMNAILETEPLVAAGRERMFDDLEVIVASIFSVEYAARVWTVVENPAFAQYRFPRLRYMVSAIAIIDLAAILPAFFAFGGASSVVLRFFRVFRMIRLAKLGRTSRAWRTIREAIYERRYEFGLVLGLVAVAVLISGSLLYWAEADAQPDKFGSIPRALWWAIVTLTTIGYGDAYPITPLGKALAALIALTGVMLIALPTGLFAASFTEGIERHRDRADRREGPDA